MLRSEVELVKRLIGQYVHPANETIEKRFDEIERQIAELKKQIQGLVKIDKPETKTKK